MRDSVFETADVFPLSLNQQNIWNLERSYPSTAINAISSTIRIKGRVDFLLLEKAVNAVISADCSLRTRITMRGHMPMQYHASFTKEHLALYDFSMTDEAGIAEWESVMTRESMPLYDSPLYRFILLRINEDTAGVYVKTHHIISDGWTQVAISNRIGEAYLNLISGLEPESEPLPSYRQYVEDENRYLTSPAYEKDRAYWKQVLTRPGEPSALKPFKSAQLSPVGKRLGFKLPESLNDMIFSYCTQNRVAPFAVFYMALAIYLRRTGGEKRFTLGVPVFNRTNYTFRKTTGMFVSTVPLFGDISDGWSFDDFNDNQIQNWLEMLRHQRFPYSHIAELAGGGGPLFNIMLSYQDSRIIESEDERVTFTGSWHYVGYQAEHLCIHVTNLEDNRRYSVNYDYLTQIFSEKEIVRLHEALCNIITCGLINPGLRIDTLPILGSEEYVRVIHTFNRTSKPQDHRSLFYILEQAASRDPNRAALFYKDKSVSYGSLLNECGKVAAALSDYPVELTAIILPKSPQLFAAMAGIMQAGSAWVIIPPDIPKARVAEIVDQSGAGAIISTEGILSGIFESAPAVPIIDMNKLPEPTKASGRVRGDSLAYVVYTSGSTGRPKGVEITQNNLKNLISGMNPLYPQGAILSLCNIGFDAFVLESAAAMLCGRTVILPEDADQERPEKLADLIKTRSVRFMAITPSRLSAYIKNDVFREALSSVEAIVCGGEAFPSELIKKLRLCTGANIYNQYGPSETTVAVSYKLLNDAPQITVGKPMPNCRFYVLDESLEPLPTGVMGNLYIGGACVGRGYRNAEEFTRQSFVESPFGLGEIIYKTGDIASWTDDGEIIIGGRLDKQIKLRGLRIEPQEISACLLAHPAVTDAAVRVWEQSGQAVLLAYYTAPSPVPESELLTYLASLLPRYMIPARVIRLDAIPLTVNGKADESALPLPASEEEVQYAENRFQEELLNIFRNVLGREDFHVGSDFFLWGGNSLNAMEALGEIEDRLGVSLRVSDLYACRSIKRLYEYIAGRGCEVPDKLAMPTAPLRDSYPLSPMQKSIYVQSFIDSTGLSYNMPGAFRLGFVPDIDRLKGAFIKLIQGDDSFRASFIQSGGEVCAVISENIDFSLPILSGTMEEVFREFCRSFELSKAPLLRAALWKETEESWALLIDMHHIIGDGISTPIIMERLNELYSGKDCEAALTYKDYAFYLENTPLHSEKSRKYWQDLLCPMPEALDIPFDYQRPAAFDYRGGHFVHSITPELSKKVDEYCGKYGLTPYMLLLGAFGILLSKISGQADIVVGTPVSIRLRPELRKICGPFINTLPVRLKPCGELGAYREAVKSSVTGMLDHQDMPLEEIIALLNLPRTLSKNPLYQVLFSMRPLDAGTLCLNGKKLEYIPIDTCTAKLDLSLEAASDGDRYSFVFEYATSLFDRQTIELYARSYEKILTELLESGKETVEEIAAVSEADRLALFDGPNHRFVPYPDKTINQIIDEAARKNPDETAIIWHGEKTTFRELICRAERIAALLVRHGVKRGDRVGLACRRTPDLLASMIGILKAGGAYLPFLIDYPEERINYMLSNADARLVLADAESSSLLPASLPCPVILTTEPAPACALDCAQKGEDPIYVLYTSGSTGQPKGVLLPHRAITNLYQSIKELMAGQSGPVLCTTNVTFDIFITETLLALAQGLCVVLADEEEMLLPWKAAELMTRYHTKITQFTPSRLQMNLGNDAFAAAAREIEFVILVGEAVTPQLVEKFKANSNGRFINMYGPTEAAVYVTQGELFDGEPVTIGVPLNNCRIYVLDENRMPVMPTAKGELYLAGDCLADGYISRKDLTDSVFLPDPFFPGQKMYKSGDMGRLRADGVLECFGRTDSQIKIDGNRVEIDEINMALIGAGASQAATVALKNSDGSTSLCGFVTPASIDTLLLKEKISLTLLPHMVPSRIRPLDTMPYNASGKIDMPLLKKMAAENPDPHSKPKTAQDTRQRVISDVSAPASDIVARGIAPEMLLDIWCETLGMEGFDADVSFFEQGGSSLGALNILSQYFNRNLVMTLEQFYKHPTASAQARLLNSLQADSGLRQDKASAEAKAHGAYRSSVPNPPVITTCKSVDTVLLTGATGFLGAHLLYEILECAETKKVYCILRDGSKERLLNTLTSYFGEQWAARNAEAISVEKGDISLPGFGMTGGYKGIEGSIGRIYHAAADVRHYTSGTSSENINLRGTENVIEFALKKDASLIHISTASISGEFLKEDQRKLAEFSEFDFDIGQNWEDNIYIKTKFLAEAAVYSAMDKGLDARVFRVGRLVGRMSDGVFQRNPDNNAFFSLIRSILKLGVLSESLAGAHFELTPVDVCAGAVLALGNAPLTTYHLVEPQPKTMGEIMERLCPELQITGDTEFSHILTERSLKGEGESLAPLIELCNRLGSTHFSIIVSSDKTQRCLLERGFSWPESDPAQVLSQFNGRLADIGKGRRYGI